MNIDKSRARQAISKAIRKRQLTRLECEICSSLKSEAHHHLGYDKENWLTVKWLCKQHHVAAHGGNYAKKKGSLTGYIPDSSRQTEKQQKIIKLIKKGRKLSEIAKLTNSSYMYVWKINKQIKK